MPSAIPFGVAAELNFEGVFRPLQRPGIAEAEPFVGGLNLPAVANLLIEDAVLIADAVADGGNVEGGEGIHEAGGKTAEAAIAEAGFGFLLDERFEIEAELAHGLFGFFVDAEVDEVVGQMRTGEELGREIADDADILRAIVEDGLDPALDEAVADGVREGHVEIIDVARSRERPCTKNRLSRKECARASEPAAVLWVFSEPSGPRSGRAGATMVHLECANWAGRNEEKRERRSGSMG